MEGLTISTASKLMIAVLRMNSIFGFKDYDHSDFTSLMIGNTEKNDSTWARYIGREFAIFEAQGRKGHQSNGYKGTWDEALGVISNYGKLGISVDWNPGSAGGRNSKTETVENFFGGYHNASSCLQYAFGGPKTSTWENEEVALKFINWSKSINDIKDVIKVTTLQQDVLKFKTLKQFIVDVSLSIEEMSEKGEKLDLTRFNEDIPECLKDDIFFTENKICYGTWGTQQFRAVVNRDNKVKWEIMYLSGFRHKDPDEFGPFLAKQIKYYPKFDADTFLSAK